MRTRSSRGFTLIELTVVVAVAVLVAGYAVPQLRGYLAASRLSTSANMVATQLNQARTLALSRGTTYEIRLDPVQNSVQIFDPGLPGGPAGTDVYLDPGIVFANVPNPPIQFYGRGLARGGTLVLQNEYGDSKSITVNAGGKITVN